MLFFYEFESKQTHFLRVYEVHEIHTVFYQNRMHDQHFYVTQPNLRIKQKVPINSTKDMHEHVFWLFLRNKRCMIILYSKSVPTKYFSR